MMVILRMVVVVVVMVMEQTVVMVNMILTIRSTVAIPIIVQAWMAKLVPKELD